MAAARPRLLPLAQSDSKARFIERVGLDMDNASHKRVYALMKADAARSRMRMMHKRESLVRELRNDMSIQPPFSSSQISESVMHREMISIYSHASAETQQYYDLSHDTSGIEPENWIIRWMLWHIFRYRDGRNRHRDSGSARPSSGRSSHCAIAIDSSEEEDSETPSPVAVHLNSGLRIINFQDGRTSHLAQKQSVPFMRRLPFDPARDA